MGFSFKFSFNKEVRVDAACLRELDEQFRELDEKIKAGDYVVEVKSRPASQKRNSCFDVVITPAANNRTSTIESMAFECTDSTWPGTDQIFCTWFDFKIKTREGKAFVGSVGHEPGKPEVPEYKFLKEVAELGRAKVAQAKGASQRTANDTIKNIKL